MCASLPFCRNSKRNLRKDDTRTISRFAKSKSAFIYANAKVTRQKQTHTHTHTYHTHCCGGKLSLWLYTFFPSVHCKQRTVLPFFSLTRWWCSGLCWLLFSAVGNRVFSFCSFAAEPFFTHHHSLIVCIEQSPNRKRER